MKNENKALSFTLSSGAYTAGMCIGGMLQLGIDKYKELALQGFSVTDAEGNSVPLNIIFFDVPQGTVLTGTYADAAASTIPAADAAFITARHAVAAADYLALGAVTPIKNAIYGNLNKIVTGNSNPGTLYCLVLLAATASSTTWASPTSLTIRPVFQYVPGISTFNQ